MQEQSKNNLPVQPDCYQTGSTKPPKSHNSLIAVLLVLVILLSGIVSVMGLMNIHLFRTLMNQKEEAAALAVESVPAQDGMDPLLANYALDSTRAATSGGAAIGILGQDITAFDAEFYAVPQGIYITGIDDTSDAYAKGLRPKDILYSFNGLRVTDCEALRSQLACLAPGEQATLIAYRKGAYFELTIVLMEDAA